MDYYHRRLERLDQGSNHLHIDCSASALSWKLQPKPVFEGNVITPQTVRSYQPVFSAAFIAHIEAAYEGEELKNELCTVVPLPNHDTDWIRMMSVFMMNQFRWSQDKELKLWLKNNHSALLNRSICFFDNFLPNSIIYHKHKVSVCICYYHYYC